MPLSVRQTQMLDKAIALVPPAHRDAFAKSVANVVAYWRHPTSDGEIRDLLRVLLSKHGISVSELLAPRRLPPDRRHGNNNSWHRRGHRDRTEMRS
jgi:hypothetical protein